MVHCVDIEQVYLSNHVTQLALPSTTSKDDKCPRWLFYNK